MSLLSETRTGLLTARGCEGPPAKRDRGSGDENGGSTARTLYFGARTKPPAKQAKLARLFSGVGVNQWSLVDVNIYHYSLTMR